MIWIILAVFVIIVSVFAWALCSAAGKADDEMDNYYRRLRGD